jgi:anti-sigma B factor antagonist
VNDRFMLEGEVDVSSAPDIEARLLAYVEQANGDAVIDCSGLTFIDSTGLSMLVKAQRVAPNPLVLTDLSETARRILVIAGLDQVFDLR